MNKEIKPVEIETATTAFIDEVVRAFKRGNFLFICGNGGSAAEADHMAAELVGKFEHDGRPALPALALSCSGAIITSLGNDLGYSQVFARQVEAYGREGDILLVITTSDYDTIAEHSTNLLQAVRRAKEMGMLTAGLVSKERTNLLNFWLDHPIPCEGSHTAEIQENQIRVVHEICREVERAFI